MELKSVLADSSIAYVTISLTAPEDVTLAGSENITTKLSIVNETGTHPTEYGFELRDDRDGLENTADIIIRFAPPSWKSTTSWRILINGLYTTVYDTAYEQELLEAKGAGEEYCMFLTKEESEKLHRKVWLTDESWKFTVDLSNADDQVIELVTEPIPVQVSAGWDEEGNKAFAEVQLTSFELRSLSAIIRYPWNHSAVMFTDNSSRPIYAVMKDGSQIQLLLSSGSGGVEYLTAEAPIILEEVDHVLLADGTNTHSS